MSYSHYGKMTSAEKDDLVDGNNFRKLTDQYKQRQQQHYANENVVLTPKRRYEENDDDIQEIENNSFQTVARKNGKKTRQLLNQENINSENENGNSDIYKNDHVNKTTERKNNNGRGLVIVNSQAKRKTGKPNYQHYDDRRHNRDGGNYIHNHDGSIITPYALHHAVTQQLPPIKIVCKPNVKDHVEATQLIKGLFSYISEDFHKLNKLHNRPMGFDTWYVDKQGALICFTHDIDLFVYLWDITHYPTKISNTEITPIPPTHLPHQHSIIFKFVPMSISLDEMTEAISDICQSKFYLEEMKGSMSSKSRHIRLDLTSSEEVKTILKSGVFPFNGQLLEVHEFLAPPQLLICNRWNLPGHTKKACKEVFDRCKRCGLNKVEGDHIHCSIKCHHWEGEHLATDYKCPFIAKFRYDLINELKRKPELLPFNMQLFIPVELRNGGDSVIKGIQKKQIPVPTPTFSSNQATWPALSQPVTTTEGIWTRQCDGISQELKALRNDYDKLKLEFDRRENELANKHENYKTKLNTMLNLLVLQNNQQNDCITKIYTVVNEIVPVITNSLKTIHSLTEKMVETAKDPKLQDEFNIFRLNSDKA